jgi:short-subunit dehydrogenase involved in D-alanine esterification of teichoic acids
MNPANNTVLITGGASGIGLALAEQFLQRNTVVICGRDAEKLAATKRRLPEVVTMVCDITRPHDLAELQAQLSARFPQLNILINNAGVQIPMDFAGLGVDEAAIEQEIQTNLVAHIKLTNRLLPLLTAQKESAIVFVGSALARVPKHGAPVYCASKAGVHSFAQSLRFQLTGTNTKVIEVVPDLVATDMTADRQNVRKVTAEAVAKHVVTGLKRNDEEILIGRTRLLFGLHRWLPAVAESIINRRA